MSNEYSYPKLLTFLNQGRKKVCFLANDGKRYAFSYCRPDGTSRYPRQYHITCEDNGTYLGRLDTTATYIPARNLGPDAQMACANALSYIQENTLASVQAYAQAFGDCSFCQRLLSNPVSITYGYGPRCASKYGMPYDYALAAQFSAEASKPQSARGVALRKILTNMMGEDDEV